MAWTAYSWLVMGPSKKRLTSTAVIKGKIAFERPGHGWKDAIKGGLTEMWCGFDSAGSG
jgi:hypothetical protein